MEMQWNRLAWLGQIFMTGEVLFRRIRGFEKEEIGDRERSLGWLVLVVSGSYVGKTLVAQ